MMSTRIENGAAPSGYWAAPTAPTASQEAARVARIGIIGAGNRGVFCFGKLIGERADARVAALCDPNPARLSGAQQALGIGVSCYSDAGEMVRAENLDGVIVTSPDYLHADHVVAALQAGARHVLVDKPLATTTEGCGRVLRAMQQSGGRVAVGFNLRHLPLLARIKDIIANGDIGELMLMENREFYDGGRTYMARWNRFYEKSGGLWIHKGSHDFDIFNWWNEDGVPQRVSAFAGLNALRADKLPFALEEGKPVGPNCSACAYLDVCPDAAPIETAMWNAQTAQQDGYFKDLCIFLSEKDVHDNGIALVEYDNNVRASHSECFVCNFSDRLYSVTGTKGTLMASVHRPAQIEFRPRWGEDRLIEVPLPDEGEHGGADPILVQAFVASLHGAASHAATVQDGLRAVAVGQAAEWSWRGHRTVEISELADLRAPNAT